MTDKNLKTLEGWIADFWEQGMERMPHWIFQDKNYCENRNEGWRIDGMYILQPGHKLVVLDDEDRVLWEGSIKARKTGFFGLKTLYPDDYEWCPVDVEFEIWKGWFKRRPPLKAKLTFSGEVKKD